MGVFDQEGFAYTFDWGPPGARALAPRAGAVVVVDVLSFTTAVDVAVAAGAQVVPAPGHDDEMVRLAHERGATVAARERSLAVPSLSPGSLRRLRAGTRLVLPSPNGATVALLADRLGTAPVFAACLRNARAVAAAARRAAGDRPVAVIAAGERWADDGGLRPAAEDLWAAGAVLAALDPAAAVSVPRCSPEAAAARAAFVAVRPRVADELPGTASGRELVARGFEVDVALAAELDVSPLAPRLEGGAFSLG